MDVQQEFSRAVKRGEAARVRDLLAADPSLANSRDAEDSTPLHAAAWKGNVEVAAILLDAGAEVDARNRNNHYGGTPLHAAAHGNWKEVAALLLERGADPLAVSCNGRTPMEETTIHKATAVARLLRERQG